jgi:hypothetical protein
VLCAIVDDLTQRALPKRETPIMQERNYICPLLKRTDPGRGEIYEGRRH